MDKQDFPRYAHLSPKERIKQMNVDIKALGWKGLGLWVRGNPSEEDIRKFIEWSKYVVKGGIIILHDTIKWEGPAKVVEEYLTNNANYNYMVIGSMTIAEKL